MSRLMHVEQVFSTRAQADAWFDSLRPVAWPYIWCFQDCASGYWTVVALVESRERALAS